MLQIIVWNCGWSAVETVDFNRTVDFNHERLKCGWKIFSRVSTASTAFQPSQEISDVIKHKFKFMKSTPTAMIRENKDDFGLGCHSISVKYHRQNAEALIHSMNHNSHRHNYNREAAACASAAHKWSLYDGLGLSCWWRELQCWLDIANCACV